MVGASATRFHREAEITSHLGHPYLVTVFDFGQAESGEPYLVMEYLEGEDLDQRLRRVGRMPIETVVQVVKQVASAPGGAHDQGVVHRDLKPGNVFHHVEAAKRSTNVVPLPTSLDTSMIPLWSSTMRDVIASPRPVPSTRREKNGSKM